MQNLSKNYCFLFANGVLLKHNQLRLASRPPVEGAGEAEKKGRKMTNEEMINALAIKSFERTCDEVRKYLDGQEKDDEILDEIEIFCEDNYTLIKELGDKWRFSDYFYELDNNCKGKVEENETETLGELLCKTDKIRKERSYLVVGAQFLDDFVRAEFKKAKAKNEVYLLDPLSLVEDAIQKEWKAK